MKNRSCRGCNKKNAVTVYKSSEHKGLDKRNKYYTACIYCGYCGSGKTLSQALK